jgi:Ubiquitin carboxyl-terminal hydrolase
MLRLCVCRHCCVAHYLYTCCAVLRRAKSVLILSVDITAYVTAYVFAQAVTPPATPAATAEYSAATKATTAPIATATESASDMDVAVEANVEVDETGVTPMKTVEVAADGSLYDLYAVVHHLGALSAGHYVASVKSHTTGRWHYFNDNQVTYFCNSLHLITSTAFVLCELLVGYCTSELY